MTLSTALRAFFDDTQLKGALVLVLIDFLLGVTAALKLGKFRLSYIADFGRNDLAFKLGPWLVLYVGAHIAPSAALAGGLDLGVAAGAMYTVIVAAWVGSIANSARELGLPSMPLKLTHAVAADENDPTFPPPAAPAPPPKQ